MLQKATKTAFAKTSDQAGFEEVPVKLGLTLTGGGVLGAFEAGVMEALMKKLDFKVIAGTSAGGGNAVAAGSGLNASGPKEAIKRLREFWGIIKANGNIFGSSLRFFSDMFLPKEHKWPNIPQATFDPLDTLQLFLPTLNVKEIFQSFKPSIVAQFVATAVKRVVRDWKKEVQEGPVQIYVNVSLEDRDHPGTFEHVILGGKNLTPDGVGGTANIKSFGFHCIRDTGNPELDGRRAYDGAYEANGPLTPMIENGVTDCFLIILQDRRNDKPDKKGGLKHTDIHENVLDLVAEGSHSPMRFHAIEIETLGGEIAGLDHIDDSSKMNPDSEYIDLLYKKGIQAGEAWLAKYGQYIGQMSSYNFYKPALEQLAEACAL